MDNGVNPEIIEENGKVNISDEVIAVVASLAASGVDGVFDMSSGVAGSFAELLGMKNLAKGVKIIKNDDKITLYLSIIVEYGCKIPDVSWNIQSKVKSEVEAMTGLEVEAVNIGIDGINVANVQKTEKAEEQPSAEAAEEETVSSQEVSAEPEDKDGEAE